MNLQVHYTNTAINESKKSIVVKSFDHVNGRFMVGDTSYPIIFPKSLVDLCTSLHVEKDIEYFFSGVIHENREWIRKYGDIGGLIINSNRGRNDKLKYTYDVDYYTMLNRTRFALCPTGECPWSYRLHEAVMCRAIPILSDDEIDVTDCGYITFKDGDDKKYDPEIVEHNIRILKQHHMI